MQIQSICTKHQNWLRAQSQKEVEHEKHLLYENFVLKIYISMARRIWCVKWYIQCSQWQKKLGWFFCAGQRECADLRKHVSWQCAPVEPGMVWPGNGIERPATRRFCTAACRAIMELGKIASRISLSPVKKVKFAQRPARLSPVWSVPRPAPRRFWHSGLPDVNGAVASLSIQQTTD